MSTHMEKSIDLAGKIVSLAEDGLRGLDRTISHWPGEFQAIIWQAVGEIASRRAEEARTDEMKRDNYARRHGNDYYFTGRVRPLFDEDEQ